MKYSTACPRNCYSACSFYVEVNDNKIVAIEANPQNKATPKGVCLKGLSYLERANSEERITFPLLKNKKTNKFEKISWEEALNIISEKLVDYKKNDGSQSVFFYTGSGMTGLLNEIGYNFWELYGGTTLTYGNLCWSAGLEATRLTLGDNKHNVPWDLENAKLIIVWGKNPAESNIHQMVHIEKAISKGAKYIVVDPQRTASSERANILIQPNPGTDAALALCIANYMIENNYIDNEFISKHVKGFNEFKDSVKKYNIDKTSMITDIPKEMIVKFADIIGKIKPMTLITGFGMQRYTNGGQTIRSILSLSVISGNIGKKGASWSYADLQSSIFDKTKEPVSYYPNINNKLFRKSISVAKLGNDILNTKNPDIKMMWIERANPVVQNPDTNNVLEAIRKIEFKVVVDQFLTDTAKEADIVLPAKNMFEQSDIITSYWNPYIQLKQKVVNPISEVKPETEIYYLLAKKLEFNNDDIKKYLIEPNDNAIENFLIKKLEPFQELSLDNLKKSPQILDNHQKIAFNDMKFKTKSGKIELYSDEASNLWNTSHLPTYNNLLENKFTDEEHRFHLLTPVSKNSIHSQFINLKSIRTISPNPIMYMNPYDAFQRYIEHKEKVKVYNKQASIEIEVHLDYSLKTNCVVIHNGWWLKDGAAVNMLSKGRETDMGYGAAFHDNLVEVEKIITKKSSSRFFNFFSSK